MNLPQAFKRREPTMPPPPVDLDDPKQWPPVVAQFAPRQQLADIDRAVRTITTFGALPTKEIDDTILALKDELAEIEADAQRVRNAYVEVTDRLLRHMERQKAVHAIARTAFASMRDQCTALDQPELPFSAPAATAESAEGIPEAVEPAA